MKNRIHIAASGERDIVMTRVFDAPRPLVWDAHTKPELVKRWLLGPEGWTMPVCEIDLRVGGKYRYVWKKTAGGHEMGMGGVFREVAAPERLVATEKFDDAWYPGEAIDTTVLADQGGKTKLTLTVSYESREARDGVLAGPMSGGMEAGYNRLDDLLASLPPRAASKGAKAS